MPEPELDLWLAGRLVAHASTQPRSRSVRITYSHDAVQKYRDGTPLLSCSLPTPGPSARGNARAFLEGLLPEGRALEAAASQVRGVRLIGDAPASASDTLQLLAAYGRECAGAVAAVPAGDPVPSDGYYEPVDEARLVEIIRDLPRHPLGADPARGIRMSLAGAQPKVLLARFDDGWFEPIDGAASTHILKPTTDWLHSAHNEALVLTLARSAGLTECQSWVHTAPDGAEVLVTARYDRTVDGRHVRRHHQEDACQALGILPREKYHLGRPSELARRLRRLADHPAELSRALFSQVAFRVIVGDEDGHGKNYSLLLDNGRVRLAPLYDSLCTLVYPELSDRMAGRIGVYQKLSRVTRAALLDEALAMALTTDEAAGILDELADALRTTLEGLPPALTSTWPAEIVADTIRLRLDRLESGMPLGEPLGSLGVRGGRRAVPTMSEQPRLR